MNDEKLRECFSRSLGIPAGRVSDDLAYNSIKEWDSVGHMALVADRGIRKRTKRMREHIARPQTGAFRRRIRCDGCNLDFVAAPESIRRCGAGPRIR